MPDLKPATPATETWDKSSKDIVNLAVAWMMAECVRQNHSWNTLTTHDPIVAHGYDLVVLDATRRGIPESAINVTYNDLLDQMQGLAKSAKAPAAKAEMLVDEPMHKADEPQPTASAGTMPHHDDAPHVATSGAPQPPVNAPMPAAP